MHCNEFSSSILAYGKNKVQIVYFSGTGGTERVASCFEKSFKEKGLEVLMVPLDMQKNGYQQKPLVEDSVGLLLLIYAVYGFGAPAPVHEWISGISSVDSLPAAVISVSGGGEMWPNTACRVSCINRLERIGFNVFYERMLVMPSNIFIKTKEQLTARILKILPHKVEHSIEQILSGVQRRKRPPLTKGLLIAVSNLERKKSGTFGRGLTTHDTCTGCGWCVNNCPRKNIEMRNGKPFFGDRCIICMRCIYGCPSKAVYTKSSSFTILKDGYSLKEMEKHADDVALIPLNEVRAGFFFMGVKKYLKDMDF